MPMKDSRMTDAWLARATADNPIRIEPKTGNTILLARLCFVNLLAPSKPQEGGDGESKPSYNAMCLLPPGYERGINEVMWPQIYAMMKQHFPNNFTADGTPYGLHETLQQQGDPKRQKWGGFTPGLICFTAKTQQKPKIVDSSGNPIVDASRVYSGVWAMVAVNFYVFGIRPVRPKKGIGVGLQNCMIVADDDNLGGAGSPPEQDFASVNLSQSFDPAGQFGSTPPAVQRPPSNILPPAAPVARPPLVYPAAPPPGYPPPLPPTPLAPGYPAAPPVPSREDLGF